MFKKYLQAFLSKKSVHKIQSWHEYYRDPNKVKVLIRYSIKIPSRINNFRIDEQSLHVRQNGSELEVAYEKEISQSLLLDLQKHFSEFRYKQKIDEEITKRNPSQYMVGYIRENLPRINSEIGRKKYSEGHLILHNVSIFDVDHVFVSDKKETCAIVWPLPLPNLEDIPDDVNVVFVRDLIDAMTEYGRYPIY